MGGGTTTPTDWDDFRTRATVGPGGRVKSADEIFTRREINPAFDPTKITVRESCDSADNPNSTPVIVALDVTGSMGVIPEALIKDGLRRMALETLDRKPVSNPHIMFMAVGDVDHGRGDGYGDRYPLQVTQFEADIRIAEQLKELFIEGHGGGNDCESYHLPWYFAARKTQIDSFDKRKQKGILFTMGDEGVPPALTPEHVKKVFGDTIQQEISTEDLLRMVQERYEVFHLVIEQGDFYRRSPAVVDRGWKKLLGQNVIPVSDYTKVPEIIVSTLEVIAGRPKNEIAASWDGSTGMVVRNAIKDLSGGLQRSSSAAGSAPAVWRPGKGRTPGPS